MTHQGGTLEITTAKICPVDCAVLCPQKTVFRGAYERTALESMGVKPSLLLSLDDFKTALSTVPKNVRINFSGFVEPFINPATIDMVEYAKEQGYPVDVFATFWSATPEIIHRLARLGVDHVTIHLPDNQKRAHLPPSQRYLMTLYTALTAEGLPITSYARMDEKFVSNERAGHLENAPKRRVVGPFVCNRLQPVDFILLPDGRVALCCQDWGLKHIMGRLFGEGATTWQGLLDSPERARIIRDSHSFFAGDTLCRGCKYPLSIKSLVPSHENLPIALSLIKEIDRKLTGKSW